MRARSERAVLLGSSLIVVLACFASASPRDVQIGASRDEVLRAFGEPSSKQTLRKTSEPIWGPIENFWDGVPAGSTVEIWSYPVDGGAVELYFVGASEQVQGTGFAADGAVYEAEP